MSKFVYIPHTKKDLLIAEICHMARHYQYSDNMEYLFSLDEEELQDEYNELKTYLTGEKNA